MSEKIPCTGCGAAILPSTAERTGGQCMPCKNGTRNKIEQAKKYYERERELDRTCPFRALWRELVDKVYKQEGGFSKLTEDERVYYSVNVLSCEVYNGGFIQYFNNTSGEHYRYAELGLIRLGAKNSLKLLRQAKTELFGDAGVSRDQVERWAQIRKRCEEPDLDTLDQQFYKDPDSLEDKLMGLAVETGLIENA